MMLCLFLFAPMPRGAFTGFQMIFLFSLFLLPEAESECRVRQPAPWMKQSAAHSRTNREECLLPPGWTSSVGLETSILPLSGGCPFPASGEVFFLSDGFLFLRIFSWSFFYPICLCFRLPPFCAFQWAASVSHFRSGRKGNSGIGRESKVKPPVLGKNLQPCG